MPRLETFIYIGLTLGAVYYLRAFLRAQRQLSGTVFGLEREAVYAQRGVALSMLLVIVFFASALYVFLNIVMPALAPDIGNRPRPTPAFAVTLVSSPGPVLAPARTLSPDQLTSIKLGTPLPTATEAIPSGIGCPNPQVTITAPVAGAAVAGPVEVKGTASIPDFAFYKFELNGPGTEGNWRTLFTASAPVSDGVLGNWDGSIYAPGSYLFRLVVYDAAGHTPAPCVIPITIVAIP
ncbi:MAG: hypothetical protein HY023_10120 [Chloroflexi bacterium]|nr:hypothetical protein [Chloroflexota bacterium]